MFVTIRPAIVLAACALLGWTASAGIAGRSVLAQAATPPDVKVATPVSVLGFTPGDDNRLDSWSDVVRYFGALASTSDRVKVETLGKTTLGRPFVMAIFSAPENLRALAKYREINHKLTDPRLIRGGSAEVDQLLRDGKTIVVVTCGVHSNEVASYLAGQRIAYRLASGNDEQTKRILQNTIVVMVPSLNPDGVDLVKGWYDAGMSGPMPLYHKYVGHDDNRDWVGFTQIESQLTVDKVLTPWRPQILHDLHQQGQSGPRLTLPPYTAPVEPNIPPQIVDGYTEMGHAMADDLARLGFTGVITGSDTGEGYDAWSPMRQYVHFHNGIRILAETASARIATPISISADRVSPNKPLPNFPKPWPGGSWTVGDATTYATAAAFSLLDQAATRRERWLRMSYEASRNAVRPHAAGERIAWLLPPSANRAPLLSILARAGVELEYTTAASQIGDQRYPIGTAVVRLDQPYGAFANAVLSVQKYPNLLDNSGRPIRPYDVTAHTLPLLLNTPAVAVDTPFAAKTRRDDKPDLSAAVKMANPPKLAGVRIAILHSESIDEGWARWTLEQNGVSYTRIEPAALRETDLRTRFDTILLPTSVPAENPATTAGLKAFVTAGGTLVALNRSSIALISALGLPVRDVTRGAARTEFYVPGSILRIELDNAHPIAAGLERESIAWVESSPAFEATGDAAPGSVSVVARYPSTGSPLLSGWLLGGERLAGKAALVEVKVGDGHVILFGFDPDYRGLSLATYPLLFAALGCK